jgi:TIR domain
MQHADHIFLSSEPLETTATSITLDIVSEEETLRGDPLPQKKILEGRITLDPQKARIYALAPLTGAERLMAQPVKSAAWDFYLVIMPFTLHKATGNNFYQSMTFFVELTTPDASAFDLFPRNVTSPLDATTYYTVSADMHIKEVEANTHQDGLRIHFEALHPLITAFGEGEQSFYWTYQTNKQYREVRPATRHALLVLQVPRGTQLIDGVISYEIAVAKSFFGQRLTIESEVDPYPIHWKLDEAMPVSPLKPPEGTPSSTEKQRKINLFYAYAPEDEKLQKELEKQLATLRRQGWIREWQALNVEAGRPQAEVNDYIERSQIILLLLSPDLLAPDRLYKDQVERALRMQEEGKARLIPILLRRTTDLQQTPFGQLVVLPRNNVSVFESRNRDKAFEEIVGEIREIIRRNFGA